MLGWKSKTRLFWPNDHSWLICHSSSGHHHSTIRCQRPNVTTNGTGKFDLFDGITMPSVTPKVSKTCDECLRYVKESLPFSIKTLWKYKHIESGYQYHCNLVLERPPVNLDQVTRSLSPSASSYLTRSHLASLRVEVKSLNLHCSGTQGQKYRLVYPSFCTASVLACEKHQSIGTAFLVSGGRTWYPFRTHSGILGQYPNARVFKLGPVLTFGIIYE